VSNRCRAVTHGFHALTRKGLALSLLGLLWTQTAVSQSPVVSAHPIFVLQDHEGPATFEEVRAATIAQDGSIIVAERHSGHLSIFDRTGRLRLFVGNGPWVDVTGLWVLPTGKIGIYDWNSFAFHYTSLRSGVVEDTRRLERPLDAPRGIPAFFGGAFADGSVVVGWVVGSALSYADRAADQIILARFDQHGTFLNYLGTGEGFHRMLGSPVYHSPFPYADAHESTLFYTNGLKGEITLWRADGLVLDPIRWEAETGNSANDEPTLSKMFVDTQRRVWAKVYDPKTDPIVPSQRRLIRGGEWWLLEEGHAPLLIEMPGEVAPYEIRGGLLVGVRVGESDLEEVVIHRIDVRR
jgi:hypothetical protein